MRTATDALLSLQRYVSAALPDMTEVVTEVERGEVIDRPYAVVSADGDRAVTGRRSAPLYVMPVTVYVYVHGDTHALAREAYESASERLTEALIVGLPDVPAGLVPLYDYTGRPAVHRVAVTGATDGTFTLAHDGRDTDPLPCRPQPGQVADALGALPGLAEGRLLVWGRVGGPFDVRYDGALRGQAVELLEADASELDGPAPEVEVSEVSEGSPGPWRTARDYLTVTNFQVAPLPDPSDRRLRAATASLRLTWGKVYEQPPHAHYERVTVRPR